MSLRSIHVAPESWALKTPFRISHSEYTESECIVVTIEQNGALGRGEAQGVDYEGETVESMMNQIHQVKTDLENGMTRQDLATALPAGGARNAIDCALWDLEAKITGVTIWERLGIDPHPVTTVFTLGLEATPDLMGQKAKAARAYPVLKVKLSDEQPLEMLQAIRRARPDAKLIVDINQGWSFETLKAQTNRFEEIGLELIEQPLPKSADTPLDHYESPIPLAADESCLDTADLETAAKRYDIINIKLDKTGGLTEALNLVHQAKQLSKTLMVGNNVGTSLSMAPAFVIAQFCDFVDLDGPLLLKKDRQPGIHYDGPTVNVFDPQLWG